MAQEPSSKDLLEAVKQQESGGRRYKADGKTLLEGPQTKYGTAKGEMQVLDMTNRDPGFGVRPAKDDSPDERARVGEDYLAAMVKRYGDRKTALVAYNWGPGNTDKWLKKGGDFAKLPEETQNYVTKITGSLGGTKVAQAAKPKSGIQRAVYKAAPLTHPMLSQLGPSFQAAMAVSMLADEGEKEGKSEYEPSESEKMLTEATARPVALAQADLGFQSPFPEPQKPVQPIKMAAGGLPYVPTPTVRGSAKRQLADVKSQWDTYNTRAAQHNIDADAYNAANQRYNTEVDAYNAAKERFDTDDADWLAKRARIRSRSARRDFPKNNPRPLFSLTAPTQPTLTAPVQPTQPTVSADQYQSMADAARKDAARRGMALAVAANPEQFGLSMNKFFAEGGEVEGMEDPQMMADKTTELQGFTTRQPDGTDKLWGPDVPVSRSAKELKAYTESMNPAVKTFTGGLGMGTRGYIYADEPDIINLNTALTPGEREITLLHELEHSMDARGGDIYGRPNFAKMGGMDNNHRAYALMGDRWNSIEDTVKNMVDNREKLEKFFGRPLDNSYFRKDSYDNLNKVGKTKAMFSEQLASLSALEQTTGKFLTQDPEMRELFPNTRMMAVYDALTGPRQTRMDARDLPPHTPVPSYTYQQNPALRFIQKSLTGENEYGTSYRPFPIKRAGGSPETGEVGYFQDPFGVPDSGPVTADTLSKGKEFKAADALKAVKEVGTGVVRNVKNIAQGVSETPYNLVGSVADVGNMVLTPFGLGSAEPTGGSAHLKRLALERGIRQAPPTDPRDKGFYTMGELGASVVNPGPIAAKGGKAAEMLAKDFQKYNQAIGPAGVAYAVKPKGGAFTGTREYQYSSTGTEGREVFEDAVTGLIKSGELMPDPRTEVQLPIQARNALNGWVESRIGNYIRRDMATKDDPFVKAVDEGKKLHLLEELGDIKPMAGLAKRRDKQGFPAWGSAKTPLGRKLEKQIDSSMWSEDIGDVDTYNMHPSMQSFKDTNPNMQIYSPGSRIADRMQFPKLIEGMEDMLTQRRYSAYGDTSTPIPEEYQLTPEKLQGLSPVDASEKVGLFNQWRDKERQVQAAQYLDKYGNTYKKYDNGRKWIAMDDLAEEPKQAELVQQAGCLGGWCTKDESFAMENGSGDKRLHLLFDEKAVPRVQLTVTKKEANADDFITQLEYDDFNSFVKQYGDVNQMRSFFIESTPEFQTWERMQGNPERITEIKGQFNMAELAKDPNSRKYLKEVQDFVKSKDWGTVANLDGINMIEMPANPNQLYNFFDPTFTQKMDLADKFGSVENGLKAVRDKAVELNKGSQYVTGDKNNLGALFDQATNLLVPTKQLMTEAELKALLQKQINPSKALGGMVEKQSADDRRYL
jgi:hypothetical protein